MYQFTTILIHIATVYLMYRLVKDYLDRKSFFNLAKLLIGGFFFIAITLSSVLNILRYFGLL